MKKPIYELPVVLPNPAAFPEWEARLEWLIEYQPEMTLSLFRERKLREKIKGDLEAAFQTRLRLQAQGMTPFEAKMSVWETEIAPLENLDQYKESPMSESMHETIRDWSSRQVEIDQRRSQNESDDD